MGREVAEDISGDWAMVETWCATHGARSQYNIPKELEEALNRKECMHLLELDTLCAENSGRTREEKDVAMLRVCVLSTMA